MIINQRVSLIQKIILITIFIFSFIQLRAQVEEKSVLSSEEKKDHVKKKGFINLVGRVIASFSDFDTLYVTPNFYELSMMAIYNNYSERYSVRSSGVQKQRLDFVPASHNRLGVYVGWQIFFVGFSFDFKDSFNHNKTGNQFELNLYTAMFGIDVMRNTSGNNFQIRKIHGFPTENVISYSSEFSGLKVETRYLNLYYIFNNKKFSYPAAYNQSTVQRISTGSFIAGFSCSSHKLDRKSVV